MGGQNFSSSSSCSTEVISISYALWMIFINVILNCKIRVAAKASTWISVISWTICMSGCMYNQKILCKTSEYNTEYNIKSLKSAFSSKAYKSQLQDLF